MILLDVLVAATGAELARQGGRGSFTGFAHDSRVIAPGECFVAVRGARTDGHDYALDALTHGAGAALVEREWVTRGAEAERALTMAEEVGATVVVVEDTREALKRYAAYVLALWRPVVIAVTGSVGKTTTKEAIAEALGVSAATFRSWRNYNDALGLPLSLGRLEPRHRYAVLELGADHPGEIAELCGLIRPQVGVVTGVSPAHLQYFGTVERLGDELARLPEAAPEDGLVVLCADDARTRAMARQTRARAVFFGPTVGDEGDGKGSGVVVAARYAVEPMGEAGREALTLRALGDGAGGGGDGWGREAGETVTFAHLHGDHWAYAVLAALTVAEALGVERGEALRALERLRPLEGRLHLLEGMEGMTLLDDSHNATPASARAGLLALDGLGRARGARRVAVLGDMLLLGEAEEVEHRAVGALAALRCDYLVTQGMRAEAMADEALRMGMAAERVAVTHTAEDAAQAARMFAAQGVGEDGAGRAGAVVYIKGSEEARMERVTARLLARPEEAERLLDRQTQAWRRMVVMRPDRPTWLEIDLAAIGRNTQLVKELVGPKTAVLVSLKADAYGHGAQRVARTVLRNGASWLGVATVSEAEPLRMAGIEAPILVFGYTAAWQAREAVRLGLRTTVYSLESARALSRAAVDLEREARAHVKVDTGMARLGLRAEDVEGIVAFCAALRALPGLVVEGVYTHFATADSRDQTYARMQLERFERTLAALEREGLRPPMAHAANSAATLTLPEARFDMVRPGIAIYGLAPSEETRLPAGFRPALTFKTQVAQVKEVPPGEGVSYGATFVTQRLTRIAVLPVGYADGFRRAPTNWGEVLVRGKRAPLIGRVCMDQCMVDVTDIAGVRQGDEVVLIGTQEGDELSAEEVARRLGTVAYEVVAELLARVPRMS